MNNVDRILYRLLLGLTFSFINWLIIKELIVDLSFVKSLCIELLLVVSFKFFIYTKKKLEL
jgi:hypothetical protein